MDTGRAVRNREYQLDETRLDKEQIVNLSITYCKTIVNLDSYFVVENADVDFHCRENTLANDCALIEPRSSLRILNDSLERIKYLSNQLLSPNRHYAHLRGDTNARITYNITIMVITGPITDFTA
jgi:hypothetical protein